MGRGGLGPHRVSVLVPQGWGHRHPSDPLCPLQQKYVRCSVRAQIRHLRSVLCHRLGLPPQHVSVGAGWGSWALGGGCGPPPPPRPNAASLCVGADPVQQRGPPRPHDNEAALALALVRQGGHPAKGRLPAAMGDFPPRGPIPGWGAQRGLAKGTSPRAGSGQHCAEDTVAEQGIGESRMINIARWSAGAPTRGSPTGQEGDGSQKGLDKFKAQPWGSPSCLGTALRGGVAPACLWWGPGLGYGVSAPWGVLAALTPLLALQPAPLLLHYSIKDKRR